MPPKRPPPSPLPARNLDYRAPDDDAWYEVRLLFEDHGDPPAAAKLRIMYCEFSEQSDHVVVADEALRSREALEEFRGRFRRPALQLQDDECARVIEGMEVCVAHEFADDDLRFYDALVDSVTNSEHKYANGELVCACTFEVFWHHGPLAGTRTQKKVQDICLIQSGYPEDPTLKYFLDVAIENLNRTSKSDKGATVNLERTPKFQRKVASRENETSNEIVNDTRSMVNAANKRSERAATLQQSGIGHQNEAMSGKLNETNNTVNAANRSLESRPGLRHNVVRHQNEPRAPIEDEFLDFSRRNFTEKSTEVTKNTSNAEMAARFECNRARQEHVISGTGHNHFVSNSSKNVGNFISQNALQNERDILINTKSSSSQKLPRPQFEIRRQHGERSCKESYYVIWIENLDKELSSEGVRHFIFEQTAIHTRVELSQSLLPIASSIAVIFIKTKEHAEKLLRFLLDPAYFVISSSRRPWLVKEDWCQQFEGIIPREENYSETRDAQCSNKIRMVYKGTREYERVEKLHTLRCEFYDHVGSLHRRLESEEKKLLLSRE